MVRGNAKPWLAWRTHLGQSAQQSYRNARELIEVSWRAILKERLTPGPSLELLSYAAGCGGPVP